MTKTIVALFDQPSEAKRAMQELRASFTRDDVAMTNGASDAAAMRLLQNGDLSAQEVEAYITGVQHGGTLVVVRAVDIKAQRAIDILAAFDTVDLGAPSVGEQQAGSVDFSALEADFRTHYTNNGAPSGTYDQYRTVYRYGYDLGTDDRYRTGDWSAVEGDARRTWEQRNPHTWEQFEASIRYAWDLARRQP